MKDIALANALSSHPPARDNPVTIEKLTDDWNTGRSYMLVPSAGDACIRCMLVYLGMFGGLSAATLFSVADLQSLNAIANRGLDRYRTIGVKNPVNIKLQQELSTLGRREDDVF